MVRAGYWRLMVPALAFVISVGLQPAGLLNAQQTAWEVPEPHSIAATPVATTGAVQQDPVAFPAGGGI